MKVNLVHTHNSALSVPARGSSADGRAPDVAALDDAAARLSRFSAVRRAAHVRLLPGEELTCQSGRYDGEF